MLMNVSENLKEGAQFFVEYKIKNASDLKRVFYAHERV